jgi:hypothetical protein
MTAPLVGGGLGIKGAGLGTLGLGARAAVIQSLALSSMPSTSLPYIAHRYGYNLQFKETLGPIANKPPLKMTLNGGYQPITIRVATNLTQTLPYYGLPLYGQDVYGGGGIANLGDVIRLTEQGDSSNAILYTGTVEDTPDEIVVGGQTVHSISLTPWVAELGDAYFSQNYTVATDVAQMVRDAVAKTAHCSVSPVSCSDSGVKAIYNFNNTSALDVLHVCKQIAGPQWWWFVDALGVVWFQSTSTGNPARVTLKRSADYNSRKSSSSISGLKNKIFLVGGPNPSGVGNITATYNGTASQATYGTRSYYPTLNYPTITDQTTLNNIATTLGNLFDRVLNTVVFEAHHFASRITLGQPGGMTLRYWEPTKDSLVESGAGTGTYSPTFVVQDVETLTPKQTITVSDVPIMGAQDVDYEVSRIVQRMAAQDAALPALTSQTTLNLTSGQIQSSGIGVTDATGLVSSAITQSLGQGTVAAQSMTQTAYTDVPGSFVSFTAARPIQLLIACSGYGSTSGGSGTFAFAKIGLDGVVQNPGVQVFDKSNPGQANFNFYTFTNVQAGNHFADLMVGVDSGQTCVIQTALLTVFKLGS